MVSDTTEETKPIPAFLANFGARDSYFGRYLINVGDWEVPNFGSGDSYFGRYLIRIKIRMIRWKIPYVVKNVHSICVKSKENFARFF
jgi:hypothetical protein